MSRVFEREKGEWWIDFKDARGIRRRRKIGPSKRVAKEVLDGLLGNVARRVHLGVIEESAISFADFAKIWRERVTPMLKTRSRERWFGILDKYLIPAFPGTLRGITAADAEAYLRRRRTPEKCPRCDGKGKVSTGRRYEREALACPRCKGAKEIAPSPSTLNREMTVLKHMMRRAVVWEYLSRNPFLDSQGGVLAGLKALREPTGRTRFLSLDEIDHLLAACEASESAYLKPFAIVAMNTGMRRNEILSLTRKSIDWRNRAALLSETKNGDARHVHLNDAALEALKALPPRIDGRLFPLGPNQTTMLFVRAAKRASLDDCRLHDLRHTFASYQAMAGVAGRGLQVLLGHKDARMTMRYSHLSDAYLKAAVDGVVLGRSNTDRAEDASNLAVS
ncbi:MAG TPA: tyrosine-type recombinase/integrase [Candidatus Binataceae bacterium]|nr:tyrosine-type recombinase/integrase [Candidatus Binataceae bacterium]